MAKSVGAWVVDTALVILAVITVARVGYMVTARRPDVDEMSSLLRLRSELRLPNIVWDASARHVVVRLLTTCPACADAVPFYRQLLAYSAAQPSTKIIFIVSETPDAIEQWKAQNNLDLGTIVRIDDPAALGFLIIPTVLIVDGRGRITDLLVERPTADEEQHFWQRLTLGTGAPLDNSSFAEELDAAQLTSYSSLGLRLTMLDIRSRGDGEREAKPGWVRIPADEVATRARDELSKEGLIVIDCRRPLSLLQCRVTGRSLKKAGFTGVAVMTR